MANIINGGIQNAFNLEGKDPNSPTLA